MGYEKVENICVENVVGDERPIVKCHYVRAFNSSATVTKWELYTIYGTVYTSGKYKRKELWSVDLQSIVDSNGNPVLKQGDTVLLKALVEAGSDSVSTVALEFHPEIANTAAFELTGTAFNTSLKYQAI